MAKIQIPNQTGPYNISASNNVYVLKEGDAVEWDYEGTSAISETRESSSNTIKIDGRVSAFGPGAFAITITGEDSVMIIGASALIEGSSGVNAAGAGRVFTNNGTITGIGYGMFLSEGVEFVNNGGIDATTAIRSYDETDSITLNTSSSLTVSSVGIERLGDHGKSTMTANAGKIHSDSLAFLSQSANDTFINTGKVIGGIVLGEGNDKFDNSQGIFVGDVAGGAGNDTYLVNNRQIRVIELAADAGTDVVRTTVSFTLNGEYDVERLILLGKRNIDGVGDATNNSIIGNIAGNHLSGRGGNDALDGGKGNDRLAGGGGADTFGFATGYGRDTIADFQDGDSIYIANWQAIDNFSQLKAHAENHGNDLWIATEKDTLIIDHFQKGDLQAGDFNF